MDSYDNIKPLIGRRFILPFIVSFFVNILIICYELNTGLENISNEMIRCVIFAFVFGITQIVNSSIIAFAVFAISLDITSNCESHIGFMVLIISGILFFVIFAVRFGISFLSILTISLVAQMSTDSRLQIQCIVLLVSQIGLFVSYYWTKYILI